MIKALAPYLLFRGEAADAVALYTSALGATVEGLMRWGDMPGGDMPPEAHGKVMHGCIRIDGHQLNVADSVFDPIERGNANHVLLEFDDPDHMDRCFAALSESGTVRMPVETTFWNARYGEVTDRYGITWKMNCDLPTA